MYTKAYITREIASSSQSTEHRLDERVVYKSCDIVSASHHTTHNLASHRVHCAPPHHALSQWHGVTQLYNTPRRESTCDNPSSFDHAIKTCLSCRMQDVPSRRQTATDARHWRQEEGMVDVRHERLQGAVAALSLLHVSLTACARRGLDSVECRRDRPRLSVQ